MIKGKKPLLAAHSSLPTNAATLKIKGRAKCFPSPLSTSSAASGTVIYDQCSFSPKESFRGRTTRSKQGCGLQGWALHRLRAGSSLFSAFLLEFKWTDKQLWGKAGVSVGDLFAHSPTRREKEEATKGKRIAHSSTAGPPAGTASSPLATQGSWRQPGKCGSSSREGLHTIKAPRVTENRHPFLLLRKLRFF